MMIRSISIFLKYSKLLQANRKKIQMFEGYLRVHLLTCGILVVGFRVESLGDHGWPPLVTVSLTDPSIFLCLGCHQLSHMKQAISLRSSHCSVASYLWFVWYCGEIVIKTMLESFH